MAQSPGGVQQTETNSDSESGNGQTGPNTLFNVRENPFRQEYQPILMKLAKIANKNELKNLRQLSQMYYGLMETVFLDKLSKSSLVSRTLQGGYSWSISPAIRIENAHIFRQLILNIENFNERFGQIIHNLRVVAPYIKSIVINKLGALETSDLAHFLAMFREFSRLLSNLTIVKFSFDYFGLDCIPIISEICDLFPTTVQITVGTLFPPRLINQYMELCTGLSSLPVSISSTVAIHNEPELEEITEQLTTNAHFFQSINNLHFTGVKILYPLIIQNEPAISNRFTMLMSIIDNGGIELHIQGSCDWFRRGPNLLDWKNNITKLDMFRYTRPLTFLRDFKNLTSIDLRACNWNMCLFAYNFASLPVDDGNLKTIFRGLWNITVTFIATAGHEYQFAPRIYPDNPQALILKQLVHEVNFEGEYWEQFKQKQTTRAQGIEQGNQDATFSGDMQLKTGNENEVVD